MSDVIFLLGAGASIDAGMPSVGDLTKNLENRLPELRDIQNLQRPFYDLFVAIAKHDHEVKQNYERLFEWLVLLRRCQEEPFCNLVNLDLCASLKDAVGHLAAVVKFPIVDLLRSRHEADTYSPNYFAKLGDFIKLAGDGCRLKVFTTNYDFCVEESCRAADITVITGFEPTRKRWNPAIFKQDGGQCINLYKLHGSLNWGADSGLDYERPDRLIEWDTREWKRTPELILGPGLKLQYDEPYVTLYSEFCQALREAKVCVAMGCGFRDKHIREPLLVAKGRGMKFIDVNPSPQYFSYFLPNYENICLKKGSTGSRRALEDGILIRLVSQALHK